MFIQHKTSRTQLLGFKSRLQHAYSRGAQVCTVVPTSCMDTQICISSNALSRKRPITVRFTGHSRIAGSQYGTCFMSPVCIRRIWRWLLDIWIIYGSLGYPIHDCTDGRDDVHSNATSTDINPLTPNDHYSGRTAPLTSKRCILYTGYAKI